MKKLLISATFMALSTASYAQCHQNVSICTTSVSIVMKDGSLHTWGLNHKNQHGDGTSTTKLAPTKVGTDADWKFIAMGEDHSWGIKNNGTLWHAGDLHSTTQNHPFYEQIGTENDWKYVSNESNMAIKTNGTLWIYDATSPSLFKQIGTDTDWESIKAHMGYWMLIKSDGTLWSISNANHQTTQIGTSNKWVSVSPFYDSFFGLQNDGTAWYGSETPDDIKQIGSDNDWKHIDWAVGVKENGTLWNLNRHALTNSRAILDSNWVEAYANIYMSMGIKKNGDVYTWGWNTNFGILGNGTIIRSNEPNKILATCIVSEIAEETLPSEDEAYPNPVTDVLHIKSNPETIQLIDVYGKSISLMGQGNYNVEGVGKGLYILTYLKDQERISHKIQIQ